MTGFRNRALCGLPQRVLRAVEVGGVVVVAPGSRITRFWASETGLALLLNSRETPNLQRAPTLDLHVQTYYVLLFGFEPWARAFGLRLRHVQAPPIQVQLHTEHPGMAHAEGFGA